MTRCKPKAAIFIAPGFPSHESDTQCLPYLQNYIRQFAQQVNTAVYVLTLSYPQDKTNYSWYGIPVYCARHRFLYFGIRTWLRISIRLLCIYLKHDIAFLHSFWSNSQCALLGVVWSRLLNVKHICSVMGQDALHAPIFKRLLTTSNTHICCCSPFAASYFREAYGRMAHSVIPWGLDKEFVNNPAVRISAQRDIDVLAVGSLSPIKNYTSLVHIIRCLILTKPNIYCVIVGDGEERATLESQIRGYQLENNIFLAGAVMRHEVRQYMLRGRIFAHPAHFEAQGYVFLEALASGMSIISFEVGFRPCSKKVYTCQNMAEFTRQLNDLLHSPFDDNPVPVKTMDETVAEYVRYHNLLDFS